MKSNPLPKYSIDVAALPDFGSKRSPSFSERFLSAVEHPGWARWLPSWWTPIPPAILAFGLWLHFLITGA